MFLGIGAHKSRELSIEGVQNDGVLRAIEFLLNVNLGFRVQLGRKVVVIGGGNVAFDVARSVVRQAEKFADMSEAELRVALHQAAAALEELTAKDAEAPDEVRLALDVAREAIRKGVPEVHMFCLENVDEIPAAREEIEEAEKEGIRLHTRFGPKRILGRDGKVTGIELIKASRVFDENRRFNPQFIEGSEETVECDTVVLAIGQAADLAWIRPEDNLKLTPRGTLQTDPATMATSRPDVFAGGDVAFGPRIIITAVAEGKRAAKSIAKFLTGKTPAEPSQARVTIFDTQQYRMKPDYEKFERQSPPTLPMDRRIGIAEVEKTYPEPAALRQADRCLKCHVGPGVQRRRMHSLRWLRGCVSGVLPAPGGRCPFARQRQAAVRVSCPVWPRARSGRARRQSSRTKPAASVAGCAPCDARPARSRWNALNWCPHDMNPSTPNDPGDISRRGFFQLDSRLGGWDLCHRGFGRRARCGFWCRTCSSSRARFSRPASRTIFRTAPSPFWKTSGFFSCARETPIAASRRCARTWAARSTARKRATTARATAAFLTSRAA